MRALLTTQIDFMSVAIPMFVLGAGVPACLITLTSLGVSDLPEEKVAGGAGLQNFLRVLCMAVGSSLTQTYWEHMTKFNREELVTAIDPQASMQVSSQLEHLGVPSQSAVAMFSQIVDSQAVMLATNDFYQSATIMMLASIGVIWFIKRPKGPLKQVTGH